MIYGNERGVYERIGDVTHEHWKQTPKERFQYDANLTINKLGEHITENKRKWLIGDDDFGGGHLFVIPNYETYNPIAMILGFIAINWDTKSLDKKLFKEAEKCIQQLGYRKKSISTLDIIRYARKWSIWFHQDKLFS